MSDAVTWLGRTTRTPLRKGLFIALCLFPILGNAISRLARHGWWLNDFDAVACGAHHLAQGVSPYGLHPVCAGLRPAAFVYAPQVGLAFAPLVEGLGFGDARLAWRAVLVPALAFLGWFAVLRVMPRAPFLPRLLVLSAMTGSVVACGNIGLVLHAIIIAAALATGRSRWPFIVAVAMAALVKPVFLTYLVVFLLEDRPLWARVRTTAMAAAVGLAGVGIIFATSGAMSTAWHAAMDAVVIRQQPGIGFFAFMSLIGLPGTSSFAMALYGTYAVVLTAAGLCLARDFDAGERVVLGIGLAQLLNPRLMDYDLPALAPAMILIVMQARSVNARTFAWIGWLFTGVLIAGLALSILDIKIIQRALVAVFVFILIVFAVAAARLRLLDHIAVITRRKPGPGSLKSVVPGTEPEG